MKKIIIFLLFITFSYSKEKIFILVEQDYPPYSFLNQGELTGIYVDILKHINLNSKDYEIILESFPRIRALKMLESGQKDFFIPMWYRPNIYPLFDYSIPIFEEELVILSLERVNYLWPQDYTNKKIGINRGFPVFSESTKPNPFIEEAISTEDNILKLINRRIDFYLNDKYSIFWTVSDLLNTKKISHTDVKKLYISTFLSKENGFLVYRTTSENLKFINFFNKEIEKMKKNGKIKEIVKKYTKEGVLPDKYNP